LSAPGGVRRRGAALLAADGGIVASLRPIADDWLSPDAVPLAFDDEPDPSRRFRERSVLTWLGRILIL